MRQMRYADRNPIRINGIFISGPTRADVPLCDLPVALSGLSNMVTFYHRATPAVKGPGVPRSAIATPFLLEDPLPGKYL